MAKKAALGFGILLLVAGIFWVNLTEEGGLGTAIGFEKEEIPLVQSAPVARAHISATVTAPGSVAALREISLHSLIQGRVLEIPAKEGQETRKDEVLLTLDDRALKSDLKIAELDLAHQKADLEGARISLDGARREVEAKQKEYQAEMEGVSDLQKAAADLATARTRLTGAREKWERYRNATGVSAEDRDRARNEHEIAQRQYESAEAAVKQIEEGKGRKVLASGAALDQARSREEGAQAAFEKAGELVRRHEENVTIKTAEIEKATVRAPMDGTVTRINVSVNDMVSPGTMNNPGSVLVTVSDLSSILINAEIDEIDVVALAKGQKTVVTVEALAGVQYLGEVAEIATTAEPKEGGNIAVFRTRILVNEPKDQLRRLRPGLSAHVEICTETHENAIAVPIQSVVRRKRANLHLPDQDPGADPEQAVQVVFLLDRDRARVRPVKTGISDDARVEILEDTLKTGEVLITGPYRVLDVLRDGDRVKNRESK